MADVENIPTAPPSAVNEILANGALCDSPGASTELGTSPTQERSSNSHPHDSEYDTASDLDGEGDYDDEDDDDLVDEGEESESLSEEEEEFDDDEGQDGAGSISAQEKVDPEIQKKVDEDRSNPQYIPKRGTFYEHDDRTAEDIDGNLTVNTSGETNDGVATTSGGGVKSPNSPAISQASKTMRKWQPASGVDRWSHDRFDASEQAPKSRAELVNAYGYDIRTEDAPPRARRRHRYGRGPNKYSRKWQDENAYLKASNKERKPPRPSDFPALNERSSNARKPIRRTREEKENRLEKRLSVTVTNSQTLTDEKTSRENNATRSFNAEDRRERSEAKTPKNKNYGRQNSSGGRQAPMEFKQRQRNGPNQHTSNSYNSNNNSVNSRMEQHMERGSSRPQTHNNSANEQHRSSGKSAGHQKQQSPPHQNDTYMKTQENSYRGTQSPPEQSVSSRQPMQQKPTPSSNLSQRLQPAQNRNDPSHVGSIQMHSLATQNQILSQVPSPQQQQPQVQPQPPPQAQPPATNLILSAAPNQQQPQQMPQEQRGPPKRYSSMRRSQREAQQIAEQHQLQQLVYQDQHMLQANLMQLYHQENIQAQMQALQVTQQQSSQTKQPTYATVPATAQPQPQPYPNTAGAPTAPTTYYVAAPDAYAAATAQAQQPPQYAPQPPNYLPQTPTAAPTAIAYTSAPPPTQPVVGGAAPTPYVSAGAVPPSAGTATLSQTPPGANQNYPNYQNYNTVGGTTYFVPPAQASSRPVVLPQRRPTNAIPILPPSEKDKPRTSEAKEEPKSTVVATSGGESAPIGSAENIDHIIDNMFVQRPAFQPPQAIQTRKSSSPATSENITGDSSLQNVIAPTTDTTPAVTPTLPAAPANNIVMDTPESQSVVATESSNNVVVAASE